jgi:hypothetical protein
MQPFPDFWGDSSWIALLLGLSETIVLPMGFVQNKAIAGLIPASIKLKGSRAGTINLNTASTGDSLQTKDKISCSLDHSCSHKARLPKNCSYNSTFKTFFL